MRKATWGSLFGALAGIAGVFLATNHAHRPPAVIATADTAVSRQACADIFDQELKRAIDPSGMTECLRRIQTGSQDAELRAWVRASDEYKALQERLKTPPVPVLSAVHLDGKALRLADGRPWPWRYASAFTVLARSDAEQDAYLEWAQAKHFTGVRLLTTAVLLADLPPDVGRARLPAFLEKLRQRGMGAEVVALADTKPRGMSRAAMREHVAGVAVIVATVPLPLTIELANENAHETQQADLQDVAFLRELRAIVPASVPVSLGSSCCAQPDTQENYPGGDYSTPHLDRGRPLWQEVARIKHLIEDFRAYVVDDEPIGAAEADEPGKRSAHPERFFAQGVLDSLGSVGATFHSSAGLTASVPGPQTDASAEAFIAGATIAPDGAAFRFVNDSAADGITHGADWSHVFKLFGFLNRDTGPSYLVALGVTGDLGATYVNGWHPVRVVAERPGVQVIEVQR